MSALVSSAPKLALMIEAFALTAAVTAPPRSASESDAASAMIIWQFGQTAEMISVSASVSAAQPIALAVVGCAEIEVVLPVCEAALTAAAPIFLKQPLLD